MSKNYYRDKCKELRSEIEELNIKVADLYRENGLLAEQQTRNGTMNLKNQLNKANVSFYALSIEYKKLKENTLSAMVKRALKRLFRKRFVIKRI